MIEVEVNKSSRALAQGKWYRRTKFHKFFAKMVRYFDRAISNIYLEFKFRRQPIDDKKIMFLTSRGTYNCHPRAIADEIIRRKLPYKIIWVVRKENVVLNEVYPEEIETVRRGSYEFYQEAYSSKVWVDNSVTFSYLFAKKRPEQVLFQTWHGTFGLKKFDASVNNNKYWVKKAYQEGAQTDYILTDCKFEEDLFCTTFWEKSEPLPYGHPRNDILFENHKEEADIIRKKVREYYQLAEDTHVLLFAPTYRDSSEFEYEELDYERVADALTEKFGGEWVVMVRYHFLDRKVKGLAALGGRIINVTSYPDIQDLMLVTDIALTDYSSWIYDYFFTKKPGLIYAPDLDDYVEKEREFLFPLESTPFAIAKNNDQLIENIKNFDENQYREKWQEFSDRMNCYEDGNAAKRFVDKLEEIMGK